MGLFSPIMVLLIPGIITLVLAIKEISSDNRKWLKIILLIVATILLFFFGIADIISKDKEQTNNIKTITDTVTSKSDDVNKNVDKTRTSINDKLDSLRKAMIDSLRRIGQAEELPQLDVVARYNQPNPVITKTGKPLQYRLTIVTGVISPENVFFPRFKLLFFRYSNDVLTQYPMKSDLHSNKSDRMQNHEVDSAWVVITFNKEINNKDTLFFLWKVSFKNKTGKEQQPLRKIYYVLESKIDSDLGEPGDLQYNEIEKALTKAKVW